MVDPCRWIERRIFSWAVPLLMLIASQAFVFAIQSKKGSCSDGAVSFRYRAAKEGDLRAIYDLLHETFDESQESLTSLSNPWWGVRRLYSQLPVQGQTPPSPAEAVNTPQYLQLQRRWYDLVQNSKVPHTWIVAETNFDSQIAGFMELGSMPSPIAIPNSTADADANNANERKSEFKGDPSVLSMTRGYRPDRPFLANLAVSKNYRRQGIARTLVKLALKISKSKWSSSLQDDDKEGDDDNLSPNDPSSLWMYLSVEKDNEPARNLYTNLNFSIVLDEAQVLSPQRLERLSRPSRLYYGKRL